MKMTFRWYGPEADPIPLRYIRQIPGMTGLMGLLDKNPGEVWEDGEIAAYMQTVHESGLACEVIESVNVHEDIKLGAGARDTYIDNYRTTVRNLARHGVKVIIYNFMPVIDWMRTDLSRLIPEDGSYSMYYDERDLEGVEPSEMVRRLTAGSNGYSLAGYEPERMRILRETMARYEGMTPDRLRENFRYFLDGVLPVCEEVGVKLACHTDDPAWPLFGLPRIANCFDDLEKLVALHDSPCNTLCVCTGSLGSNAENDVPAIIRHFGAMNRIGAMHVRNVKRFGPRVFRESSHLSSDGDLDMLEIMRAIHDTCPDVYVRPDHGRMIWDEQGRPGYGLYDRALGAAYINGLWEAVEKLSRS